MTTSMKQKLIIGAAAATLLFGGLGTTAFIAAQGPSNTGSITVDKQITAGLDDRAEAAALQSQATISAADAEAAALAANPGATVIETELENEHGSLVYDVELSNGLEVTVDAGNAAILYTEQSDDASEAAEAAALQSQATISAADAEAAALAANPGATVIETELEYEHGVLVYDVELSNGLEVTVDAGNAAILYTEQSDDEHETADTQGTDNIQDGQQDNANEAPGAEVAPGQ